MQDLISSKSKGGIGAPWAEDRDRPIAGIDIAEKGWHLETFGVEDVEVDLDASVILVTLVISTTVPEFLCIIQTQHIES